MLASINPARMDPFRPSKVLPKRRRRLENAPAIEHADGYQRMRVCIFGAGAVGSHFSVRLALTGHEVSCVMRGPHLDAAKAGGLTLRAGDVEFSADVRASEDPAALGPQDVVISTLKATGLQSLVDGLPPLLHEDTAV